MYYNNIKINIGHTEAIYTPHIILQYFVFGIAIGPVRAE